METPVARVLGIAVRNELRKWSKKSLPVLSTLEYSKSCWIFCTGLPWYLEIVALPPEVAPTIISPTWKCLFASI